ncbi:SLBB domain-containing protein [Steroidobacter agaridevorans]|uniref:SLBB domain-containing protein n=1 Tax=Steroidobacter agaridevorans TaxID=2695856 RepID=UPI001326AA6B|nr:SLBB domain-containing protein [Steroidobacter agaridevorans]GFE85605.1 sugar ABC transporter substrate-binding protein [Steroidobacter agaridevorans]
MLSTSFAGRALRLASILVYLLFSMALSPAAVAQTPSADQIEMFQNMSPEQQRAIMEAMGGGGMRTPLPRTGVVSDRPLEFPQTVRPRARDEETDGVGPDGLPREPKLKGGDTVLLTLEVRQFKRKAPEIEERERREERRGAGQPAIPGRQMTDPRMAGSQQPAEAQTQELLERTQEETVRLEELRERVLRRNPYKLDKWGILNIPELGPIPLAGLTANEATQRISAELRLADFIVALTRLPLKAYGSEALKPFGYDLFAGSPSTFAPATDVPVPSEYVVGPGDTLQIQLIGSVKGRYALVVGRDGRINIPELEPVPVAGLRFEEVRERLEAVIREQMIGTDVNVSMGELRSIRVFVLGDAEVPGSYTVSGLSTITNALFVSGGVKEIGSLRNIQLKRAGRTVTTLDLYALLLHGDTSADARLLPGDVIFVPPVGATVGLAGEVRRPAIYELKAETAVGELLELGGGLLPEADPTLATLERVNSQRQRVTVDVNLSAASGRGLPLQSGDTLRVPTIRAILENSVAVNGHVHRSGEYQFTPGMRLSDVLPSLDELKPNADQRYILVRREMPADRQVRVFSADLEQALADPNGAANFELAPRDQIFVFDRESGRDRIIEPLMRELRLQSRIDEPTLEVSVAGKVKIPGTYPLEPGMRVSDLLRAGGSLDEAAYGGQAELTRYEVGSNGARQAELIEIDLRQALNGDPTADLALRPFDYLVIKEVPLWAAQEEVEIRGEVRFPGRYPIHRGETLRSVMARAGGLTDLAFPEGAIFTREELKERERKQLATLATRMESDLAQASLMSAQEAGRDASSALAVGQSLLATLREAKPVGRLVIDLERSTAARSGSEQDIVLKDGDRLLVPRVVQEVTVIGEVQSTTSHLFRNDLSRDDYIAMSGGLTPRADDDHIYVVRADGSVVTRSSTAWFSGGGVDIKTGDTIVAPLDTERMRPLPFWIAVTTIIYNLSIAAAAVNSF